MKYSDALTYIHSLSRPNVVPGLNRIAELLDLMRRPQDKLQFIHVAGTNGKGSTCAMLAKVLSAAGYNCGLFTSPFIERFNERISINGVDIDDVTLATLTAKVKAYADIMAEPPTEFDFICAIGMEYFAQCCCDIVVLEVGLGGEFDSTNVIDSSIVSLITSVDYDHVSILGESLAEIATAKAGIIKQRGDLICADLDTEARKVIVARCKALTATLHDVEYSHLQLKHSGLDGHIFSWQNIEDIRLSLLGKYQIKNAALCLSALDFLKCHGFTIPDLAIRHGLSCCTWPARFELLSQNLPTFILDGAHNLQGIEALKDSLAHFLPEHNFVYIIGLLADKDLDEIVKSVSKLNGKFITTTPPSPRALPASVLATRLRESGKHVKCADSICEAVELALNDVGSDGAICAFGSLYFAAEIRRAFNRS